MMVEARTGAARAGVGQAFAAQPGTVQADMMQIGAAQPGTAQPNEAQPGSAMPGTQHGKLNTNVEKDTEGVPFYDRLAKMESSPYEHIRKTASIVRSFLREGIMEFTRADWMKRSGGTSKDYYRSYKALQERLMIATVSNPGKRDSPFQFMLPDNMAVMENPELRAKLLSDQKVLTSEEFWDRVESMKRSRSPLTVRLATIVRDMIDEGITEFTAAQWIARTGMTPLKYQACQNRLITKNIIYSVKRTEIASDANNTVGRRFVYRFTLEGLDYSNRMLEKSEKTYQQKLTVPHGLTVAALQAQVEAMEKSRSVAVRQGAGFVKKSISENKMEFTEKELMLEASLTTKQVTVCLKSMLDRNMLIKVEAKKYRLNILEAQDGVGQDGVGQDSVGQDGVGQDGVGQDGAEHLGAAKNSTPQPSAAFEQKLKKLETGWSSQLKYAACIIRNMIAAGIVEFTAQDWVEHSDMSYEQFCSCRVTLRNNKIIIPVRSIFQDGRTLRVYKFNTERNEGAVPSLESRLADLEGSNVSLSQLIVAVIREMVSNGIFEFTKREWMERSGMNKIEYKNTRMTLLKRNIIIPVGEVIKDGVRCNVYRIVMNEEECL